MKVITGVTIALLCFAPAAHASETQLKEGNRLFRKGQYDLALKKYNDALRDAPNSSVLKFNAGGATYQMGNFSEAEKQFQEVAALAAPAELRAAARYNQGNAQFRQGKWKEAIDSYKESLRINPNDEDAKYNLGVALETLRNPPPPPKPQSNQDKKDKSKEDQKQSAKAKPGDMSKEDAERLLEAVGAGEPKKQNRVPKNGARQTDEDW